MAKLGVDLGYGYTKVYPDKEKFRSSVYPYTSRYGFEEKKGIVEVDGEGFEVGRARSIELRTKRFQGSPEWRALLHYALRSVQLPAKLVLGFPISLSSKETRKEIERSLVGAHRCVIDGEERDIEISVVIDVGFFTIDVLVYRHGEILEDRCSSYEIGVGWMLEALREELKVKYSYPSISLKETEEFFMRGYFPYEGKRIEIDKERWVKEFKANLLKELRAYEEVNNS